MLLREIKNIFHKELDSKYGKNEVNSFFSLLTEHYLGLDRFVLALEPNLNISKKQEDPIFNALAELKLHRPVQYIIGYTQFMDLKIAVDERVLIPRPETEELVRWIISDYSDISERLNHPVKILDIGTGSGCIAIALKKYLPDCLVYALDISEDALKIARSNAAYNEVTISFILADILTQDLLEGSFDIIVSNPPYVRELEKAEMSSNVKSYEPKTALFVSDKAPLIFYEKIGNLATEYLNDSGILYLEINQYLGKETRQLLEDKGFSEIEIRKDIFGNNRMLKGEWKANG